MSWGRLSFHINQDSLWWKVALMTTVFKTIETIGGGIYFVSITFMKRQHFPKNDKKIIPFVLFKFFRENPPNSFDGFQLTMSQSTF